MRFFFILALFCLVGWSCSQKCPAKYSRFSAHHTFCIAPNRQCQMIRTGISQQDKELIVRKHNELRSKIAMGDESGTKDHRQMPQAADMMQMVWDDELAAVAQKWAENCYFDHDCNECRAVENFGAGQNLAIIRKIQTGEPYWESRIQSLYDEVADYPTSWLASYASHPGPMTGHFTQLIWSKSWRIGCGYAYYNKGGQFEQYYACNYGPSGNVPEQPVYKQGSPCSACPTNTQCSTSGRGPNSFPGLCKMNNPNTAPTYRVPQDILFYCGASSSDSDCQHEITGDGSVRTVDSVGGNYYSIVLRGGQSTTLTFTKKISPHVKPFCLRLTFQKGPLEASSGDQSSLVAHYTLDHGAVMKMPLRLPKPYFMDFPIDLRWNHNTKLSFVFSVPSGAGEHVFDLRKIMAFDGACAARKI